jgi:ribonuclease HI
MENTDRPAVTIYTDGGADPNPGPGGWGAILLFEKNGVVHKRELKGGEIQTTNNRMEITAAIAALKALKSPCYVELFTDSEYLQKGISEWLPKWKNKNFKKVKNADLWQVLDDETSRHTIHWQWVKGHASDRYNERADELATAGRAEALGQPVDHTWTDPYRVYLKVSAASASGAWAALLEKGGEQDVLSGSERPGVQYRLYLLAAIAALETMPNKSSAYVYTDSDYLRNGIQAWIKGWKQKGWVTKDGAEVKYRVLWERLDQLAQTRNVKWSSFDDDLPQLELLRDALEQATSNARHE